MSVNDILQLLNDKKQAHFFMGWKAKWQPGTGTKHERREIFLLIGNDFGQKPGSRRGRGLN